MVPLARVLIITILSDLTTVTVLRGVPFLAREKLGFDSVRNLGLTLSFGACYVVAALLSHRAADRFGERKALLGVYLLEMVGGLAMTVLWPVRPLLYAYMGLLGAINGAKWPLVETLVTAGRGAADQARALGRFNLAWSASFLPALAVAGPLIHFRPGLLFLLPGTLNAAILAMVWPLPARPTHLAEDHPDRLPRQLVDRWQKLLLASRWLHLLSNVCIGVFGAIVPSVLNRLGVAVVWATSLSATMDLTRFFSFLALGRSRSWHGRVSPLLTATVLMTGGFCVVALGGSLALVLVGEVLFGLGVATIYYAALYYGLALSNAAVSAGGVHEALIGVGIGAGPAMAMVGETLLRSTGGPLWGVMAGLSPAFAVCITGMAVALLRLRRPRR